MYQPTGPDADTGDMPVQVCLTGGRAGRTNCEKIEARRYVFQTLTVTPRTSAARRRLQPSSRTRRTNAARPSGVSRAFLCTSISVVPRAVGPVWRQPPSQPQPGWTTSSEPSSSRQHCKEGRKRTSDLQASRGVVASGRLQCTLKKAAAVGRSGLPTRRKS